MSLRRATILLLVCGSLVVACDTTVEPFLQRFAPPVHVVDGFIDARADTQFVRIQKLRQTRTAPEAVLDEFVVTTRIDGGQEVVWQDAIVTLDDGSTGHQFSAPFAPGPGARIELSVSDADATTMLVTDVPSSPRLSQRSPTLNPVVVQPVQLVGLAARPPELTVTYEVEEPETSASHTFSFAYATPGRMALSAWEFDVFLTSDRNRIGLQLGRPQTDTLLVLNRVSVDFELLSTEWDEIDNEARPPGFFGSIGTYSLELQLNADIRDLLKVQ